MALWVVGLRTARWLSAAADTFCWSLVFGHELRATQHSETQPRGFTTFRNTTIGLHNIQKHNLGLYNIQKNNLRTTQHSETQPLGFTTFRNTTSGLHNIQRHKLGPTKHSKAQPRGFTIFRNTTSGYITFRNTTSGYTTFRNTTSALHNIQRLHTAYILGWGDGLFILSNGGYSSSVMKDGGSNNI